MKIENLNVQGVERYTQKLLDLLIVYGPKVLLAIIVLIIGLYIINKITSGFSKLLNKRQTDSTLSKFIVNMIGIVLKTLLFISVAQMVGIETTSFVAVMAAASLAIGMALQGSLGNFAGGALILFFKPYKIGDLIEAQGNTGHVKEIQLFTTHIVTFANRLVIIPNGPMSNGNIINHSAEGKVRVDIKTAIAADEDIDKARAVMMNVLRSNPVILEEPLTTVNVSELGDYYTQFLVLTYCLPSNYWTVLFSVQEDIRKAFQKEGIKGPKPYRVIEQL